MGIPFVTEIISFYTQSSFKASVVTDLINVLNGVFIFIMFVCKDSVIKMLKKRFAEIVGPLKPVSLTSVKTAITRLSASQHSWEPNESQGSISNERALKQTQQCQIMSVKILDDCE